MQPGFEKTLPPKKLAEDGSRYIFPTGTPAPGSNLAPAALAAPAAQDFVANPELGQAMQGAALESNQPVDMSQVVTRQPVERAVAGAPQAQGYGSTPESLIMSGLQQGQDAASQSIGATDALMSKFEKDEADRQQRENVALTDIRKKIEDTDKEVANFKWDNKSVWEKSNTGQKVALAIGGFLSSLTPKSAEAFQNSIDTTMKNDLEQQKASYLSLKEKGKDMQSYYGQLVQKFGSEQAADMAMMSAKMQMIQNKLKVTADTAQSKLVAANALSGLDLVKSQKMKYEAEAMKLAKTQQASSIPGYSGTISNPAILKDIQERSAAKDVAIQSLGQLKDLVKEGARLPLSKQSALYDDTRKKLAADVAKAMAGGKYSDFEYETALDLIPKKYGMFNEDRIKSLESRLTKEVDAYAKTAGLKKAGSEIGRLK
jgi:hypothetical protein